MTSGSNHRGPMNIPLLSDYWDFSRGGGVVEGESKTRLRPPGGTFVATSEVCSNVIGARTSAEEPDRFWISPTEDGKELQQSTARLGVLRFYGFRKATRWILLRLPRLSP